MFLFFLYRGFTNGFFQELSSVVGLVGGFFLARSYTPDLTVYLSDYISAPIASLVLSILIIMLTLFVASLFARLMTSFFKIIFLGWVNHLLGALLGFAKGALIICVLIYIIIPTSSSQSSLLQESIFLPYYEVTIEYIAPFFETNSTF